MAMWMLSFYKPCVIPLSETYMMLVLAMHCAVLLEGLRTTATLIVFLLCSHNSFLTLTKLSQSRSSFPVQELSVSLGDVIPLVFLPRAAVFDFYKFIRPLFVLCHSSHNTFLRFTVIPLHHPLSACSPCAGLHHIPFFQRSLPSLVP